MTAAESSEVQKRLEVATEIAREAGHLTLEYFRTDRFGVERKGDGSPVTIADKNAEKLLRERISQHFPEDAILGEEFGETEGPSGFRWVLDPIDGTKSFINGVPLYTTLIGVLWQDDPVAGVIRAPALDEVAFAMVGGGAHFQAGEAPPRRVRVSETASLAEATFVTSEVYSFTKHRKVDARPSYDRLQDECRVTRTWGDGYGYLLVAIGCVDIAVDPVMNLWDAAALMPVITEAGGVFTDWQGRPTVHSPDTLACNPRLAPQAQAILKNA